MARTIRWLSAVAFASAFATSAVRAGEMLPVKFTLEWKFTGPTSFYLLAAERGYYAAEGLGVRIDSGQGSEATLTRIASGAYDLGFSDLQSLVPLVAGHPEQTMRVVMVAYDAAAYAACTLKGRGIETPKDLAGKTMGAPVFEDAAHFFPSFAKAVGFADASVKRQNLDPALRAQMVVSNRVDFITALAFGCDVELPAAGAKKDDVLVFQYSDYGLHFYGNSIVASGRMIKDHPDSIRGFIRATIKGMRDMIADNQASLAALKKRDPLIDERVELERMRIAIAQNILTPTVLRDGVGAADQGRIEQSAVEIAESLPLPRRPSVSELYDGSFLPPQQERMLK